MSQVRIPIEGVHCKASELQLGDHVELSDGPWSMAIVEKIDCYNVHFFRPYGTTADFSYSGGVICYIGVEQFCRPLSDTATFKVMQRTKLK